MKTILLLLFFSTFITVCSSYNYLVFCPLFAHSHHKYLAKIADTLSEAGHNVTFLAPIIVKEYQDIKYLEHTSDIIYIPPDEILEKIGDSADYSDFWTEDFGVFSMAPVVIHFSKMFDRVYENFRNNLTLLNELKARNYDGFIYEPLMSCSHPVHDYLGIKAIFPSFSMTHFTETARAIGEPMAPSVFPTTVSPYGDQMTFKERVLNTLGDFLFSFILTPTKMTSYNYPHNILNIAEIESRAPFVFMNSNPYLDFPRPVLQKTVQIGGISVNVSQMRAEKLPEEFASILKSREKSMLISFGSMMLSKEMPMSYKETIIKVIESLPDVTFIWKYESEDVKFAKNLKNLHFSKWVPQTALLADARLTAFLTHAGLGSVNELSYLGKPAVLVPMFADQLRNAKMLARHNGSISLTKHDLKDFEKLKNAIEAILYDESYQNNAQLLGEQLESQPISPRDLLVKHAEFGAKFGQLPSLDPYSRKMSFFSFYMIDIILFFTVILLVFGFILFLIFRKFLNVFKVWLNPGKTKLN